MVIKKKLKYVLGVIVVYKNMFGLRIKCLIFS